MQTARRAGCLAAAALGLAAAASPGVAAAEQNAGRDSSRGIVDLAVAFEVRNINSSWVGCASDGATYTIRGHLIGPRAAVKGHKPAVTLYLHSLDSGQWDWRPPVRGYDYAKKMARRGHVSVVIDRLGYDSSGHPDGYQSCIGSQADVAHQIVQQLRSGGYSARRKRPGPSFSKVVLAGHSLGALIAEVEAYSYKDVDGLIVVSWTDLGGTQLNQMKFERTGPRCLLQSEDAEPGGPGGYIFYDLNEAEFRAMFRDAEPRVVDAVAPLRNRTPCGDLGSILTAIGADAEGLKEIDVPVLLVYGADDRAFQGFAQQRDLFSGSDDVTLKVFERTGHYLTLERTAPLSRAAISKWLRKRNFGDRAPQAAARSDTGQRRRVAESKPVAFPPKLESRLPSAVTRT